MSQQDDVLAGGGELGARIRKIDWSRTALGSVAAWPQSLRSALSICIGSRFPIAIYWGPELVLLYNDAWSPILGDKHPSALGRPGRQVWPEIWDTIAAPHQGLLAANGGPESHIRLDQVHVLVVEDELDSRELLRVVLETVGARVTAAGSAREALVAPGPFDIIVSDVGIPEMDGYDFLQQIRSSSAGAGVPALALTAYARGEDAERALRAGYQEHITKPVDAVALLYAVRRWTGKQLAQPGDAAKPPATSVES